MFSKYFCLSFMLASFFKIINCMESPIQQLPSDQAIIPQIIMLISSEGNRYTLNGPKLLQAEYFKTLLRFEQAKSKAPETVTEINIKMPNAILEPITALINIAHASSELIEEQAISKLMDAIGNITNIDERIISLLIQAHTFEQYLITKAIARCIAEVIAEKDVIYFRQLAPHSEHQNLHPAYQVLIVNEMLPTIASAHWLLQWLIDLNEEDNVDSKALEPAIEQYAKFLTHNSMAIQDQRIRNQLMAKSKLCLDINYRVLEFLQQLTDTFTSIQLGKTTTQESFIRELTKIRQALFEIPEDNKLELKMTLEKLIPLMAIARITLKREFTVANNALSSILQGLFNIQADDTEFDGYQWILDNPKAYESLFE